MKTPHPDVFVISVSTSSPSILWSSHLRLPEYKITHGSGEPSISV